MNWKKFSGPAILAGIAILIWLAVNVLGNMMYDDGDTIDPGVAQTFLCMGLISILMCLEFDRLVCICIGNEDEKDGFLSGRP
jgi:hypothetical protein